MPLVPPPIAGDGSLPGLSKAMRRTFLLTILSALGLVNRAVAQPVTKSSFEGRPYDARPSDLTAEPELAAAVADILEAARRVDATLLEPWLADSVYPIGNEEKEEWSKSRVMAHLQENYPDSWDVFTRALSAGVRLDADATGAVAPFTEGVMNDVDDLAVISERVDVFQRADVSSPVLGTVGYVVMSAARVEPECDQERWLCVAAKDGGHGYIARDDVRELIEFEIHFSKTPSGWRVTAFGATC